MSYCNWKLCDFEFIAACACQSEIKFSKHSQIYVTTVNHYQVQKCMNEWINEWNIFKSGCLNTPNPYGIIPTHLKEQDFIFMSV